MQVFHARSRPYITLAQLPVTSFTLPKVASQSTFDPRIKLFEYRSNLCYPIVSLPTKQIPSRLSHYVRYAPPELSCTGEPVKARSTSVASQVERCDRNHRLSPPRTLLFLPWLSLFVLFSSLRSFIISSNHLALTV